VNRRRKLIVALGAGLLAAPLASLAQQQPGKISRIGFLQNLGGDKMFDAFRSGLADLGYVEGKNIIIERRSPEGKSQRLDAFAAELVGLNVGVLVALTPPAFRAAIKATQTIPIVMRTSIDPVEAGIVTSLAHPGGNVTGIFSLYDELNGKRLELLKEAIPTVSRVMLLWNPVSRGEEGLLKVAMDAARRLGLHPLPAAVNNASEFGNAFTSVRREHANGLLVLRTPLIVANMAPIAKLANAARLPAIYDEAAYTEAGGLMSYGASLTDLYRHAAVLVDKILKGAKPGDLPIEQPTKFELVINMKTAKTLGIKIPQSILVRADKVIE